jgi:hypothetical protein
MRGSPTQQVSHCVAVPCLRYSTCSGTFAVSCCSPHCCNPHRNAELSLMTFLCVVLGVASQCYAGRNETQATRYGPSANCVTVCPSPSNPVGTYVTTRSAHTHASQSTRSRVDIICQPLKRTVTGICLAFCSRRVLTVSLPMCLSSATCAQYMACSMCTAVCLGMYWLIRTSSMHRIQCFFW